MPGGVRRDVGTPALPRGTVVIIGRPTPCAAARVSHGPRESVSAPLASLGPPLRVAPVRQSGSRARAGPVVDMPFASEPDSVFLCVRRRRSRQFRLPVLHPLAGSHHSVQRQPGACVGISTKCGIAKCCSCLAPCCRPCPLGCLFMTHAPGCASRRSDSWHQQAILGVPLHIPATAFCSGERAVATLDSLAVRGRPAPGLHPWWRGSRARCRCLYIFCTFSSIRLRVRMGVWALPSPKVHDMG